MASDEDIPLHPDTLRGFSYVWSAKVHRARTYTGDPRYHVDEAGLGFRCGACGSDATRLLYREEWGSNAGTGGSYEVRCEACGRFTVFEKDD